MLLLALPSTHTSHDSRQDRPRINRRQAKRIAQGATAELAAATPSGKLDAAFTHFQGAQAGEQQALVIPPLAAGEAETAIEATDLTLRFGDFTAVDQVSFAIRRGEIFGFLGSNGCGKTNCVDAIRWVLGEQSAKALRGGKMQDVIFEGADTRKPAQFSEVALVMTECEKQLGSEFHEIEIMRRVHRDGQSEYFFNGQPCRLKDIHKLFMDTGVGRTSYSIMAQGQIDQILSSKPSQAVHTVPPGASVREAIELMARQRIGSLLIVDGARILGIFTERDYAQKVEVRGRTSTGTPISEVMTPDVIFVTPATTSQECMALMTGRRLRHLPVMDQGTLVGLISIGDLVKDIISEQQFVIAQLESYIHS